MSGIDPLPRPPSSSLDRTPSYDVANSSNISIREALSRMRGNMRQISTAPREIWVIFVLKFFSSYAYFTTSLILTLFLSREFGFSDIDAGWCFGMYGVMTTVFGVLCGWVIDFLGVRYSLILGSFLTSFCRIVITLTKSRTVLLTLLCTLLPFGESLGIPIMTIGIKRYTNATNRTFGYSLFYSVMNVAAFIVGPVVDFFRAYFQDGTTISLPFLGETHLSALRTCMLSSAFASVSLFTVALFFVREVEVDEHGNITDFTPSRTNAVSSTWTTFRDRSFWRLAALTCLLIGVRLVFAHNSATMPKYLIRQFGVDAPFGLVFAINPLLIIFLVPLVGLLTKHIRSFPMILYGSILAAASPLFICIDQSYLMIVLYMTALSLGEAVYSPRTYEYSMELSANGSEGLYGSLAAAPLFSVQLLVGGMSGWLISEFMPKGGEHHGKIIWGIISLTCLTSPVLMCIFRDFIDKEKVDSSPADLAEVEKEPLISTKP